MATPRVTEDGVRKRAHVVALRRQRLTFDEIGERLGISQARASQLYRSALAAIPASGVEQHRAEEQVLIDDAIASLMVIARDDTVTAASRTIRQFRPTPPASSRRWPVRALRGTRSQAST